MITSAACVLEHMMMTFLKEVGLSVSLVHVGGGHMNHNFTTIVINL